MEKNRKSFRASMKLTSKDKAKKFFKFTDEISVDYKRLEACNSRVKEIFARLNNCVDDSIKVNLEEYNKKIDYAYAEMKKNDLFKKLTNNGRNPVDVYFNWLRGYAICEYFVKAISLIFDVNESNIKRIGKDDFTNIKVFKRTADADFEIQINKETKYKLEVQSGFTGVNDIKKTKIDKAKNVKQNENIESFLIHFDIFNGQAALYCTSDFDTAKIEWILKFENSKTVKIPDDAFKWDLENTPLKFKDFRYN